MRPGATATAGVRSRQLLEARRIQIEKWLKQDPRELLRMLRSGAQSNCAASAMPHVA